MPSPYYRSPGQAASDYNWGNWGQPSDGSFWDQSAWAKPGGGGGGGGVNWGQAGPAIGGLLLQFYAARQAQEQQERAFEQYEQQLADWRMQRDLAQQKASWPNVYTQLTNMYGPSIARAPEGTTPATGMTTAQVRGTLRKPAGIEGRAEGGPVDAGQVYLTGEFGPEMVLPSGLAYQGRAGQTLEGGMPSSQNRPDYQALLGPAPFWGDFATSRGPGWQKAAKEIGGYMGAGAGGPYSGMVYGAGKAFGVNKDDSKKNALKAYGQASSAYHQNVKQLDKEWNQTQYDNALRALNAYGPGFTGGMEPYTQKPNSNYALDKAFGMDPYGRFKGWRPIEGYTPAAGPEMRAGTAFAGGVQARAAGGPVDTNQPYMVGEQGPEVIVPQQAGTVVPNNQLGSITNVGGPSVEAANDDDGDSSGGGSAGTATGTDTTTGGDTGAGTTTDDAAATEPTPGELVTAQMTNLLQNPGEIGAFGYEATQEQANQGLNAAMQGISGGLTGRGIDPSSGLGQMLGQSAVNANTQMRTTAARDLAALQESLYRQDIAAGESMYQNALAAALGLAGTQSTAALGGGVFPNIGSIPTYQTALPSGLSLIGYMLAGGQGQPGDSNPFEGMFGS
jgi:hypothetical protein